MTAIAIGILLWLAAIAAFWALCKQAGHLDNQAAPVESLNTVETRATCGAHGPKGMRCDRDPHDPFERHEQDGLGWRCAIKTPSYGWWLR